MVNKSGDGGWSACCRCVHHACPLKVFREGKMWMYVLIYFLCMCAFKRVITFGLCFKNCADNSGRFGIVHFLCKGFGFGSICSHDMFASFKGWAFSSACTGETPSIKPLHLKHPTCSVSRCFSLSVRGGNAENLVVKGVALAAEES